MWFLIKSTVFICLILVVLSFFSTDDRPSTGLSAAGVTNAVISAGEVVHYISGICAEKPDVCTKGAETFAVLSERTRDGAKVAFQLLEGQFGEKAQEPVAPTETAAIEPVQSTEKDGVAVAIRTGTIAQAEADISNMRIPVPMKRPQVH